MSLLLQLFKWSFAAETCHFCTCAVTFTFPGLMRLISWRSIWSSFLIFCIVWDLFFLFVYTFRFITIFLVLELFLKIISLLSHFLFLSCFLVTFSIILKLASPFFCFNKFFFCFFVSFLFSFLVILVCLN